MKIIHVITGLNDGGAEGVLFRLSSHDLRHKHIVISLSSEGKYGPLLRTKGVEVRALGMSPRRLPFIAFIKLIHLLYRHKPDVVQTWMPHADLLGGLAARLAGARSVVWGIRHSNLDRTKSKKITKVIVRVLAKLSWWLPSRIAVCAKRAMDSHEALGYDRRKMRFIPNGYALADSTKKWQGAQALRAEWGIDSSLAVIGTVARYDPQKDHINLLQSLALLRARKITLVCVLVGTNLNNDNEELVRKIRNLGLEEIVVLLDKRKDIPSVMGALDLHVLPSASEAFPNVVAEAMACETPCVVTDVGDAAFIVGDTGWVVPPRDSKALADAIERALEERQNVRWSQRCLSARRRIEQEFGIDKMIAAYHELWCESL